MHNIAFCYSFMQERFFPAILFLKTPNSITKESFSIRSILGKIISMVFFLEFPGHFLHLSFVQNAALNPWDLFGFQSLLVCGQYHHKSAGSESLAQDRLPQANDFLVPRQNFWNSGSTAPDEESLISSFCLPTHGNCSSCSDTGVKIRPSTANGNSKFSFVHSFEHGNFSSNC